MIDKLDIRNILFISLILVIYIKYCSKEPFIGAMNQLYSKGPMDLYLTNNSEKHLDPCYKDTHNPFPHTPFVWNNPSRIRIPYYYDLRQYYDDYPHKCG